MKKRESITIAMMIFILVLINVIGFVRQQRAQHSYDLIIEEEYIQISVNRAASDDLEDLPGIGPVLAAKIIAYRDKYGPFYDLEDLKNVKGIGDKLFMRIFPYIKL